jgi:uncharacterized membrane protein YtjA (UPF0391 family)
VEISQSRRTMAPLVPKPWNFQGIASRLVVGGNGEPTSGSDLFPALWETRQEETMLYWALVFFVVAVVAAVFGFGGIAAAAAGIAKILFFVFLALFALTVIAHLIGGHRRPKF